MLEEKGELAPVKEDCTVSIDCDAFIPEKYVPYPAQRMALYKRIALIETEADREDIADELAAKLVSETEKLVMGNPLDTQTTLGTLISEKAAIQVEETVNNAVKDGAEILAGGVRDGAFYQATVIDHVTRDMDLVVRETFGPVAPIIRVKDLDEAIDVANDTEYGLQAGVFTSDYSSAMRCAYICRICTTAASILPRIAYSTIATPFTAVTPKRAASRRWHSSER